MIKAGGVLKMVDEEKVMMESLLCLRRAGADIILTYFARQRPLRHQASDVADHNKSGHGVSLHCRA
jgi:delta-aminolevulinic acid dehydratase/porphobilinogen synthase